MSHLWVLSYWLFFLLTAIFFFLLLCMSHNFDWMQDVMYRSGKRRVLFLICCCFFSLLLDWVFHLVCTNNGFYFLVFALNLQYSMSLVNSIYLQVIMQQWKNHTTVCFQNPPLHSMGYCYHTFYFCISYIPTYSVTIFV